MPGPGLPNQLAKFAPDSLDQRTSPTGPTVATSTHRDQIKAILEPFRWIQLIIS
ncbi:hypothetical protein PtrSN002B_007597 [Pyrenophora tritici-repentis]|uniref:Uncharacterized protein n=1 Tax=Pyrenophora tritici-repentis TaxID=45151 RepID=A0A2W1DBY5_9PLEO|nr:hypothetical protein PtrV1_01516 [Pyrenophora tritici-repentis]KAF7454254.1 hypothetical protein A1F99_015120 [Pyrenophora tritici-repentis]KAF7577352.1 hypothetical protein PtrM4_015920 [Pyrenophora tritici-repentis]KAG9388000.1 hypothetical protein A1F94_000892 [Pyrenophora tritici-repentis]KAI0576397.1 hypothetical protein Alg215_07504 [Pyrenophora tritici-repentis]